MGPHGIITGGEVLATVIVGLGMLCAMLLMAYRTRGHA